MASKSSSAVFTSIAEAGEGLDALVKFAGQIQQPAARRDGIMKSSTRQWAF
jgi:hypothetical protein